MSAEDLLKLACHGDFMVIRTRITGNSFEIKYLKRAQVPIWAVWSSSDTKELFESSCKLLPENAINVTRKPTSNDLNRILEKGFRIIRPCDTPCICIKELNKDTKRWIIIDRCKQKQIRNSRLNELLTDKNIISLD